MMLRRLQVFANGIEVDVAFQYNDQYSESILSFVNNVRTKTAELMK